MWGEITRDNLDNVVWGNDADNVVWGNDDNVVGGNAVLTKWGGR